MRREQHQGEPVGDFIDAIFDGYAGQGDVLSGHIGERTSNLAAQRAFRNAKQRPYRKCESWLGHGASRRPLGARAANISSSAAALRAKRVAPVRRNLRQRGQHEGALVQPRVGQRDAAEFAASPSTSSMSRSSVRGPQRSRRTRPNAVSIAAAVRRTAIAASARAGLAPARRW